MRTISIFITANLCYTVNNSNVRYCEKRRRAARRCVAWREAVWNAIFWRTVINEWNVGEFACWFVLISKVFVNINVWLICVLVLMKVIFLNGFLLACGGNFVTRSIWFCDIEFVINQQDNRWYIYRNYLYFDKELEPMSWIIDCFYMSIQILASLW